MVPGQVVAGFRVEALLGEGAMGQVFRARHLETERAVAIKVLHAGADHADRQRFAHEGLAMGRLSHPHLLAIHTSLEVLNQPALVMELAAGGSLASRLERGPVPPQESTRWVAQLASGLAAAHAAGVLHRDLKPENVLFDEAGRPKLADFGLARVGGEERLTATHELLGTPLYMAPEQARGETPSEAVDVYALGAVLYHCLAGRPPLLPGPTLLALLERLQREEPPRLDALGVVVPARVQDLCLACLTKDPSLRPSAAALAEDLARAWEAPEPGRFKLHFLGALGLVLVAVLTAGALHARRSEVVESPTATQLAAPRPTSDPHPSAAEPAAPLEFAWPDLGPEVAAKSENRSVLAEAVASLAAVASLDRAQLYEYAGRGKVLVSAEQNLGLPAALVLARRGHTYGLIRLATHHAPIEPSKRLPPESRDWLWTAALHGDSEALFELGCANEYHHGERSLAVAYRFLGIATRPLRKPTGLEADLARDELARSFARLTPARAWREVWRAQRPVEDEAWRSARRKLAEDPAQAVERYLVLFDAAKTEAREALAGELTRAAELAWTPLLGTSRLVELHTTRTVPASLTREEALDQATRVLRRVRWARGLLLDLELRVQVRGWGEDLAPPDWVQAALDAAEALRPGSDLLHFARFRAALADPEQALRQASASEVLLRRGRDRARLRDAQRWALQVGYSHDWTPLETARRLMNELPASDEPPAHWRRLLLEHLALRRRATTRAEVEARRADFLERLAKWPASVLSEQQKSSYRRRLEHLPIKGAPPRQARPTPTSR